MLLSVAAALTLISFTCGENPAVKIIVTNKGLQYGKHVGAGWIQDKLELVSLPEVQGKLHIGFLGDVDYTLTGVTITKCDFPEPSVEFYQDPAGFKASSMGLSVALTGDWATKYGLIHDTGSFEMAIFSVDVTSVVKLGKDADGRLNVTSVSCDASVGDVDLQIHGEDRWILQLLVNHNKDVIRGEIADGICPHVEEYIVNLEHHLQAMNVSFDVNKDITLDLPLTDFPTINASSLNLGLKGECYSTKTPREPPFKAQPFRMLEHTDHMLSLGLSEFTLNSASYGYYSAGLFQALINDSMIPSGFPLHLNTSLMGPFIPQLPKMFPGLLINLQVYAREVPLFSLQPGAVNLDFKGTVKAFAVQSNGTQTPLFTLNVDAAFSGKVWIGDGRLKGSIGMNNLSLTLVGSEVGPFEMDPLEKVGRLGLTLGVSKLNEFLGQGFDLPRMKQAELVNTVLEVDEGFMVVSSDAQVSLTDFN